MKKILTVFCAGVLTLGWLTACNGEVDVPKDSDGVTAEATTPPVTEAAETEIPVGYPTVEQMTGDDAIIQLEQVGYDELDGMDMSQLPESYAAAFTGVRDHIHTYQVMYRVDACTVTAFISVPDDYTDLTRPLLIYNRGGNGNFGASTPLEIAIIAEVTDCVVIASQYRETAPGTGTDEFGGADVADVMFWVERVKNIGFVDAEKVYMVGVSRGGMQTCLALQADTEGIIRAAACVSGVYDLAANYDSREDMRDMLTRRIGGTPTTAPEAYAARSAVSFATDIRVPILLIHSKGDSRTEYTQATAFAEKLEEAGKNYHLMTRETASHGLETIDEWQTIMDWLERQ